jgi:succinate dehydrogenase/fumarate reductase cytochrome b subunit (b558 family)
MQSDAHAPSAEGRAAAADARHFRNRKLHSLLGVLPLGAFILEHLFTNAFVLGGQRAYDKQVDWLLSMPKPVLWGMEILLIAFPLAFHGLYGVKIALEGRPNVGNYAYRRNRFYAFQRWTSMVLLAFIVYHVWTTRFAGHTFVYPATGPVGAAGTATVGATSELVRALDPGHSSIYYFMVDKLSGNWLVGFVYLLGVASACFHFANGMWTFCISWGITVGAKSQNASRVVFTGLGLTLFGLGAAAVLKLVLTQRFGAL